MKKDVTMETKERWRIIPGFSGRYFASDRGHIANRHGHVMAERAYGGGDKLFADLSLDGQVQHIGIADLVLRAFVSEKPDKHRVKWLDGNRANNALSNIEWGLATMAERELRRVKAGQHVIKRLTDAQVADAEQRWVKSSHKHDCLADMAALLGVTESGLWRAIKRRHARKAEMLEMAA